MLISSGDNERHEDKATIYNKKMHHKRIFDSEIVSIAIGEPHFQYKKRLLLRCIYYFESDLINKMDHMRISSTEPSVILSQKVV